MLRRVAEGVLIHQSEFVQTNAIVVQGPTGVLLIDPGVHGHELSCIAGDLADLGQRVVAGFSTHPHWDHLLWHARFGPAPRYATARCAGSVGDRPSNGVDSRRLGIPEDVPLELLGLVAGLPAGTTTIPWDGPRVTIIEHRAHAPGHAALLVEDRGVLLAGDMLSDVLIPMLDLGGATDPVEDYLAALRLLEAVAGAVEVFIPGHGSIGGAGELDRRIRQDRAYLQALADPAALSDPRTGPSARPGWEWVGGVHERQLEQLQRFATDE